MVQGVAARIRELAADRSLQVVTLIAAAVATAAAAAPVAGPSRVRLTDVEAAVATVEAAQPAPLELVWRGLDVDGDGRGDFTNPTGLAPREHDAYGEGAFGASRDGGVRRHEGVDFEAVAGQTVVAPLSGFVSKIGFAYAGDNDLRFVEITNPALDYAARVFYIDPGVEVGDAVAVGDPIGEAHSLQRKYPGGMTDHVHLEVIDRKGRRINAERVITAQYVQAGSAG